jgi:SAM-dependent methyltransferase
VKAIDPKALAQERFAQPHTGVIDIISRCATDPPLAVRTLVDAVRERANAGSRVAEFGFGSGWLLEELRAELPDVSLCALDLSPATVERAQRLYGDRVRFVVGDMEELPFRDRSFDVIVTCWTLYFMRDIDAALHEITRCLTPGGRLIVGASAPDHEIECAQLVEEAARTALGRELEEPDVGRRFDLETGLPQLARHFPNVDVREWHGEMVLSELPDVLGLWGKWQPAGLEADETERVRAAFERLVSERLKREGSLRTRRHDGAFVCDLT